MYLPFLPQLARGDTALWRCTETQLCWVETPCRIEHYSSRQHGSGGKGGSKYEIIIRYHYEVDGRAYCGERYSWWKGNLTARERESRLQEIREAATRHCYVNPQAPQESVYDSRILWRGVLVCYIAGGGFFLLGLLVLYSLCRELCSTVHRTLKRDNSRTA